MNRPMSQLEHMMAATDAVLTPKLPPTTDAEMKGRSEEIENARAIKFWDERDAIKFWDERDAIYFDNDEDEDDFSWEVTEDD